MGDLFLTRNRYEKIQPGSLIFSHIQYLHFYVELLAVSSDLSVRGNSVFLAMRNLEGNVYSDFNKLCFIQSISGTGTSARWLLMSWCFAVFFSISGTDRMVYKSAVFIQLSSVTDYRIEIDHWRIVLVIDENLHLMEMLRYTRQPSGQLITVACWPINNSNANFIRDQSVFKWNWQTNGMQCHLISLRNYLISIVVYTSIIPTHILVHISSHLCERRQTTAVVCSSLANAVTTAVIWTHKYCIFTGTVWIKKTSEMTVSRVWLTWWTCTA